MTHNHVDVTQERPGDADVMKGELAPNVVDGILFSSPDGTDIVDMGGAIIHQNLNKITADYTLRANMSGVVASGFTIDNGVTLTIPNGATLSIV